jgi:hypothetical protein
VRSPRRESGRVFTPRRKRTAACLVQLPGPVVRMSCAVPELAGRLRRRCASRLRRV